MFMVISGIYEQKLKAVTESKTIEYKFIPRTYYDEQLEAQEGQVTRKMASMFDKASPWFDQAVGSGLDMLKTDR